MNLKIWLSKTVLYAVLGAGVHVASNWKSPAAWAEGASIVGAAYGARKAIAKGPEPYKL